MAALHEALLSLAGQTFDTVIHIGADTTDLTVLNTLQARQMVLVQGDPEAAAEMRAFVQKPGQQVVEAVVAAAEGPLRWHSYSLSSLNGPLDALNLSRYYPRLRQTGLRELRAVDVAKLLDELCASANQPNLLLIDLPGQEQELLNALPLALLHRFDWIVLRGFTQALLNGYSPQHALNLLETRAYLQVGLSNVDKDPLWTVGVMRLDAERHRQMLRDQRLAELEILLAEQQQQYLSLKTRCAEQDQLAAELGKLGQECSALVTALDQQNKLTDEKQAQLDAMLKVNAELAADRDRLEQERIALIGMRDRQARLANDRQTQLDALAKDLAQVSAERDKLNQERTALISARDNQAKLANERQTQLDGLTKDKAQLSAERSALVAARDEQTKQARTALAKVTALETELTEVLARYGLLQEELIKAEAQIELIADLLLREPRP